MEAGITMEAGIHLPQIDFGGNGRSPRAVADVVEAARRYGFAAVSANDHFVFPRPWLDGPTLLAKASEHSGSMDLVTSIALPALRGPVALASALSTLQELSPGRVIAGVGAGSSRADHEAVGSPFEERWARLDRSVPALRSLLGGRVPIWIGSWGSPAGLRRVARLGDGWLASAYNTDPETFTAAVTTLGEGVRERGIAPSDFPHALVTMWTWVTESRADAERVLREVIGPVVRRDPEALRGRICVGSAGMCADLLSRYARAGCRRVHFWPVADEARQIELLATRVLPLVGT
jgi:alkanesulfonate monooxygenase SsuD/methylene tetrahydromethanopterin reductase-like flavin-dependent oxidoreductase (luciferase family)